VIVLTTKKMNIVPKDVPLSAETTKNGGTRGSLL